MTSFGAFSDRKARESESAPLARLHTLDDRSAAFDCVQIGNGWSRDHYDGLFSA